MLESVPSAHCVHVCMCVREINALVTEVSMDYCIFCIVYCRVFHFDLLVIVLCQWFTFSPRYYRSNTTTVTARIVPNKAMSSATKTTTAHKREHARKCATTGDFIYSNFQLLITNYLPTLCSSHPQTSTTIHHLLLIITTRSHQHNPVL